MKTIKFDLSCFKPEFQEFIFKKINCNDYFEFINNFENNFTLNLLNISLDKSSNTLEEDIQTCTFRNVSNYSIEDSSIIQCDLQTDIAIDNIEKPNETNIEDNIEKIISQIDTDESDDEDDEKNDIQFSHYVENNQIYVTPNKKFISKRLAKTIKKNGGYWVKTKNMWIFPMSSMSYIENTLKSQSNSLFIKNINQEKDKVVITPKQDHPKYGAPVIYDKSGNLGVWDNILKGWIFQKKN